MIRFTVYFSGKVQGVGFRYTAVTTAQEYAVSGYVENLPDGRVRLVAEGDRDQLQGFVSELAKRMAGFVRDWSMSEAVATGEFGRPGVDTIVVRY